jgi:hypothetical protein
MEQKSRPKPGLQLGNKKNQAETEKAHTAAGMIFFVRGCVYPGIRCLAREEFAYMGSHEAESSADLPHPSLNANPDTSSQQTPEELKEEQRKIRRLQMMMNMVMSVIGQDESLTVDEAAEMVADSRRAALAMFPDKELAYNLIYKPRLQRLMRERYRIQ